VHTPYHPDAPDRDALVHRIGMLIVTDKGVDAAPWDGYALIVRYDEAGGASRRMAGFRYRDGAGFEAATPGNPTIGAALDALREGMRGEAQPAWDVCVVQIRRDTRKVHVDFEYDDPRRWDITPATLTDVAERARPAA
jgi:hypothetical protein